MEKNRTVDDNDGEFREGLHSGVSIFIGYLPVAMTFGLIAKATGLTLIETVMMSLLVFAGAAQYIALSLLAAGTGMLEIVLTTFIVNIRHFLMAASLNEKAERGSVFGKVIYAFGITDETFTVASMRQKVITTSYMLGLVSISYFSWVINSGLGYLLGSGLPKILQDSMSIALYAMFIGLLVPSMKKGVKVVFLAALAACLNSIFTIGKLLPSGWAIVAATIISAVLTEAVLYMKKGADKHVEG
ncbi:AzlC family ABC transporter permease [Bacillus massilinigeriensis]|uniref:AzlC family ABC transporter permease n=1 Tax=Bacillus mediterraneensis TaxID=1805474 RepID=UPI0008F82A27|nr:AzlC family ABC transporter permease [Bacillus mediterraneensis]